MSQYIPMAHCKQMALFSSTVTSKSINIHELKHKYFAFLTNIVLTSNFLEEKPCQSCRSFLCCCLVQLAFNVSKTTHLCRPVTLFAHFVIVFAPSFIWQNIITKLKIKRGLESQLETCLLKSGPPQPSHLAGMDFTSYTM